MHSQQREARQLPRTLGSLHLLLVVAVAKLVVLLLELLLYEPWVLSLSFLPVLAVNPKNQEQDQPPSG